MATMVAVGVFDRKEPGRPIPNIVRQGGEKHKKLSVEDDPNLDPLPPGAANRLTREREQQRLARHAEEQQLLSELRKAPRGPGNDSALATFVLADEPASVACMALSPDGKLLACGIAKKLAVWEVATRKLLWAQPQSDAVRAIDLSAGGLLAAAVEREGITIRDAKTGQGKRVLPETADWVYALAFSPDGKTLAAPGKADFGSGALALWDVQTGAVKAAFPAPEAPVLGLAFAPDGRTFATAMFNKEVTLWNAKTGKRVWHVDVGMEGGKLVFSPDSRFLAVGSAAGNKDSLQVLDLQTRTVRTLPAGEVGLMGAAFSPDGKILAAVSSYTRLHFWDVQANLSKIPVKPRFLSLGSHPVFSPGGTFLVAWGSGQREVRLWEAAELLGGEAPPQGVTDIRKLGDLEGDPKNLKLIVFEQARDADLAQLKAVPALVSLDLVDARKLTDAALVHLKHVPKLRQLDLEMGERFTDAGLAHLQSLTALEELNLGGWRNLTDAGLAHLAKLPNLKILNLRNTERVTDAGLAHLKDLTKLTVLRLGRRIGDAGVAHLKGLVNLQVLELSNGDITDAGMQHLAAMTRLVELHLLNTQITDAGLVHLKGAVEMKRLFLGQNNQLGGAGLAHLEGMKGLNVLDLDNTSVDDAGLGHLKGLANLANLRLGSPNLTDGGLEHLGALTELGNLDLGNLPKVSGSGLKHLKPLLFVKHLRLSGTGVTDAGLEGIKELTQMEGLSLPGRITDAGFVHLASLQRLQWLDFGQLKGFTGAGLKHLAKLRRLHGLTLSLTGVTDAGLENITGLTQLKALSLPPAVTNAGLAHLKGLTNLESLGLFRTKVTDAGLVHLRGLTRLRTLDVGDTQITDNAIAELRKVIPELRANR